MSTTRLDVARYKRLAIRSVDAWQGGLVRLPMWIQEREGDSPYRPTGAFWRSARTGLIWVLIEPEPRTANAALALRALLEFGQKYERELMGRPARIEVSNARVAEELRELIDDRDTTIAVVEHLPEVEEALRAMAEYESGPMPRGLLETAGVTFEHVRRFAEAACDFYKSEPWEALEPGDLLSVEAPGLDAQMRYLAVTGSTRETRGVMFYATRDQFERFLVNPPTSGRKPRMWIVAFDPIDSLPFADVDAWEDLALPVAADDAYPRPGLVMPTDVLVRPNARQLAHLEAILRTLAATTDDEFDAGEWTRMVDTAEGALTIRLSLPRLLEQMADQSTSGVPFDESAGPIARLRFEMERTLLRASRAGRSAATPEDTARVIERVMSGEVGGSSQTEEKPASSEEHAQELAHAALASSGRRRIQLARRALVVFPDCADAWSALGSRAIGLDRAVQRFREAVAAGERALGPDAFAADAGHFWEAVETRPYMRARIALANCLEAAGAIDDAVEHYRDMLRLNPVDNQAVRHRLLDCLLEQQRDVEARALIDQFKDDESPDWKFAAALVAFRRDGDSVAARALRADAVSALALVVPYLTGERELPAPPPAYRPYSREHAVVCASWLTDMWQETPGACDWLSKQAPPRRGRRRV
jgi:tetratricopeptide (TPR) repeat protein